MQSAFDGNYKQRNAKLLLQACACFNQHVKDDQDALEIIFRLLFNNKSQFCSVCNSDNTFKKNGSRTIFCLDCKKLSWFTANTFFDGIRRPRAYLLAIWLIECGISFSANWFAKYAKISYDTAWIILKKLDMLVEEKLAAECIFILSSHFRQSFIKRSCETPAKQKPEFEQDECEKLEEHTAAAHKSKLPNAEISDDEEKLGDVEKLVLSLIRKEQQDIDSLVERTGLSISEISLALMLLELNDFIKPNFGGKFEALPKQSTKTIEKLNSTMKAVVRDVNSFVRTSIHGISRRYLQFYLARFWCLTDKMRWGHGELVRACARASRIRKTEILNYVSPLTVKIHSPGTGMSTQS